MLPDFFLDSVTKWDIILKTDLISKIYLIICLKKFKDLKKEKEDF